MKLVTALLVAVTLAGGGIGIWASQPVAKVQDERTPAPKANDPHLVRRRDNEASQH